MLHKLGYTNDTPYKTRLKSCILELNFAINLAQVREVRYIASAIFWQ